MNCPRTSQTHRFAAGEPLLDPEHFSTCPSCRSLIARFDELKSSLATRAAVDLIDREIAEQVLERSHTSPAPRPLHPPARFSYVAAAALLLGAFGAGLLLLPPIERDAGLEPADIGLSRPHTPERTLYIGSDGAWVAAWWADEEWKTFRIDGSKLHRGLAPVGAAGVAVLDPARSYAGWFFDPASGRSVKIPPSPKSGSSQILDAIPAAVVGRRLVVWGVGDGPPHGAVLDLTAMQWNEAPEAPIAPRYRALVAPVGNRLVVWGGYSGDRAPAVMKGVEVGPLSDGALFDPVAGQWTPLPAAPRAFTDGMAAAGGLNRFAVYDPKGRTAMILSLHGLKWIEAPGGPALEAFPACAVTDRYFFVWNGYGAMLDLSTGEWKELPDAPIPGRRLAFARVEGARIRVWGGWADDKRFLRQAAEFDMRTWSWRKLPDAPVAVPSELHPGW